MSVEPSAAISLAQAKRTVREQKEPPQEEPRPLQREMPPPELFPTEALGDVLGAGALAIEDKIQCPAALAGMSVLGAASLSTQAYADVIHPATRRSRPLSIYLVTVAASGERKTAADGEAHWPTRKREATLREQRDAALPGFVNDHAAWKAAREQAVKNGKGDRNRTKTALDALGPEPVAPLVPMLIADEPSYEGLTKLYAIGQPSLGLCSDEGGAMLGGYGFSEDHKLRMLAGLSSLWDGAPIRRVRSGDGALMLLGRRLSMHLMVQPGVATKLFSDHQALDQGFLSRILVSAPASNAGTRFHRPLREQTDRDLKRYGARLLDILEKPLPLVPGTVNELAPRQLPLSPSATELWLRMKDATELMLGPGQAYEPIKGFANKLPEHALRLAGVLALVDNVEVQSIGAEQLERAIALVDYFASEALRLFEAGAVPKHLIEAEQLRVWLMAWPESIIGLVATYQFGPNSIRDKKTAKQAIAVLEEHGWLVRLPGKDHRVRGKPVREAWSIVRRA